MINVKMLIINILCTISSLFFITILHAQNDSLKYDFSFQFQDGIYLEYSNFKDNKPININKIISPNGNENDFFDKLNDAKIISFYDDKGIFTEINKSKIWGYSKNGRPYIYWANKFNFIPTIGSISHFVSNVSVYHTNSYYDPFYYGYGYNNYGNYQPRTYKTEELQQFLIDFETGKVVSANVKNVETIISRLPELQKEFSKLGKRQKTKKMFEYIRRYNEQMPIFFPISQ